MTQEQQDNNERICLTKPSDGLNNDGLDNEYFNLIVHKYDVITGPSREKTTKCRQNQKQYTITRTLGVGMFGQVFECIDKETKEIYAIKILKNLKSYYRQGLLEVTMLELLNNYFNEKSDNHILQMYDHFIFKNHLCFVTEKLGIDTYQLACRENDKCGKSSFTIERVRKLSKQLLESLDILQ